jgi:hypothetical protein
VESCEYLWGPASRAHAAAEMRGKPEGGKRGRERAPALRACSACAGDYEDPDRTAGTPEEELHAEDLRVCEEIDEEGFPAEK